MSIDQEIYALLKAQGLTNEQAVAMMGAILQPQATDPYLGGFEGDYGDANKAVDYGRDVNTLLADPMTGAAAGLAGFGGGMLGVDQFMPIREYVEGPKNARLQAYLAKPLDTLEGWMADIVTREGALGVTSAAQQFLSADPAKLTPEQLKIRQQLEQFQFTDNVTGETRLDLDPLRGIASDLEQEAYLQADPNAQFDPETGQYYIEKPSEMQDKFDKLGLPSPTLQYGLEDFSPEAANAQGLADLQRAYIGERTDTGFYDQLDQTAKDAYARYQLLSERGGPETALGDAVGLAKNLMQQPRSTGQPQVQGQQGDLAPGNPGGIYSIFGQEGNQVQDWVGGVPNPASWLVKGAANTLLRDESPFESGPTPWGRDGQGGQQAAAPGGGWPSPADLIVGAGIGKPMSSGTGRSPVQQRNNRDRRNEQAVNDARREFLAASQQQWNRRKPADEFRARNLDMRAQGYKSMDDYRNGTNKAQDAIGQGRLDFNVAQAQGRTPLSDTLRQRALAAYLLGG